MTLNCIFSKNPTEKVAQWIGDNVHHAAKDQDARRQLLQTDLDHDLT